MISREFWAGRRVFLTGQTGFKGAWIAYWLDQLGAEVHGFGLPPDTKPNLYSLLGPTSKSVSRIGDIRDPADLADAVAKARPSVVIHMAAQSLVLRSYREPIATAETNVNGTINLLEALRTNDAIMASLAAVLVVTTDKVYRNSNDGHGFKEADPLGGHDPYSASKAAVEILSASWAQSFFAASGIPLATARTGNVVGGGDWSEDRLVPDLWRAARENRTSVLRHPDAIRPWQWVLEPLAGYLGYVEALVGKSGGALPRALNFGPPTNDTLTVAEAANLILSGLGAAKGWTQAADTKPTEAQILTLDAGLAGHAIKWRTQLTAREALQRSVDWYRAVDAGEDPIATTLAQIKYYETLCAR